MMREKKMMRRRKKLQQQQGSTSVGNLCDVRYSNCHRNFPELLFALLLLTRFNLKSKNCSFCKEFDMDNPKRRK